MNEATKMASSLGDKDHSRFAALDDSLAQDWHSIDAHLRSYLSPLLSSLSSGRIGAMEAGEEFSSILSSALLFQLVAVTVLVPSTNLSQ